MAKRQMRKKHRQAAGPGRRRKLIAALTLTILCAVSVTLVARVTSRKKAAEPSSVSVASFTPDQPAKEYVYAGGKLIATEEPQPSCTAPSTPTGLSASPDDAQVTLNWTASSGATSYNVKRSQVSGGPTI